AAIIPRSPIAIGRGCARAAKRVTRRPIRCIRKFFSVALFRVATFSRARRRTFRLNAARRPLRRRVSFVTHGDPGVPSNLNDAAAADAPADKRRGVIYTIAPSPLRAATIWIGTDDGLVQLTKDDGKTWQNVTPPALTSWSKVVMIEASHFDVNEAFAAVERHQLADYEPHIYRTHDSGKTWTEITKGLPAGVYVQTVKEDPNRRGLLFTGTERAVFVSFDDGDHWQSLQLNLPPA